MGLDPITLGIGIAGAGALGGVIAGASDDPDQQSFNNSSGTTNNTTTNQIGQMTDEQRQLQQSSLQQYLQQIALAQQYEQGMGGAQGYQDMARQQAQGIMGGSAFQLTPQEQQLIDQQRNAQIDQSSAEVNRFLDQRLGQLAQSAGERGVRGQALSQLQGDALRAGAEQLGTATRAASAQSAQQAQQMPYQRLAAQSPYIQQGMTLADQMNLQAQQNRQLAQSPFLLGLLNQNRQAENTSTTNGTNTSSGSSYAPGAQGSFLRGLSGGFGGLVSGATAGAGLASGINSLNRPKTTGGAGLASNINSLNRPKTTGGKLLVTDLNQ